MADSFLLRRIEEVTTRPDPADGFIARCVAVRCTLGEDGYGYLTGESLADQGIETTMPNLPDLDLPPADTVDIAVDVRWLADDAVRIVVRPAGTPGSAPTGTEHGIVTRPRLADVHPVIVEDDHAVTASGGRLRVVLDRAPFALRVEDTATGGVLVETAGKLRQVAGLPISPAVLVGDGTQINLVLGADESILGFGEQFSRLVKNGQRLRLRVEDALGTGTGLAYKPAPVWYSTAGYGALVNTGATVVADVEHSRTGVLSITAECDELDLHIIAGPEPKTVLSRYTALTGRGAVPPTWAFGFWLGRCRYHSAEEMETVAATLRELDVPCDILHLDPDWLIVDRLNTDFIWNESRFGDRRDFIARLRELGVRLSVWELPYLDPASPLYPEAVAGGHLVHDSAGGIAHVANTPIPDGRPRALIDFTRAVTRAWWQDKHTDFLADGVAVFKTDFGEGLPDDVTMASGRPAEHAHNLYPLQYNGAVSDGIGERTGRAPLVWGRSGWAGSHRYPAQWGGDAESTVSGMRATLRGGLSHAMSMPGLWGHDIGGFFGPELTPGLYVRWTQFGALSPLMRAHGLRPREPYAFGDDALRISREWIRLRYSLLPYLWQVAQQVEADGTPMMRPPAMEFPEDEVAVTRDDAFMLGSDLLVVPIFDDGDAPVRRRFYVPAGGWTDIRTGERYTGPGMVDEIVPLDRMPVLVRDGAVLPRVVVPAGTRNTDDLLAEPWDLHVYGTVDGPRSFVDFDGGEITVVPTDGGLAVHGGATTVTVVDHATAATPTTPIESRD